MSAIGDAVLLEERKPEEEEEHKINAGMSKP
jgi:hypothetical protein